MDDCVCYELVRTQLPMLSSVRNKKRKKLNVTYWEYKTICIFFILTSIATKYKLTTFFY